MLFTVNTEVCTRCGLCVADCPTGLLVMTDDGPKTGKGGCISCGHCVAVCPTLALDSDLTPRAEQVDITNETKFTPEQAELFLRSRRSIRNYQNKPVPAELIRKVLNVARMAPTATNTQGISYIVIRDKQKLRRIADLVLEWMHIAAKTVPIMRLYGKGFTDKMPLFYLAVSTLFSAYSNIIEMSVYSKDKMWSCFFLNLLWAIVMIGSASWLVDKGLSATGIALAVLIAYIVKSVCLTIYLTYLVKND